MTASQARPTDADPFLLEILQKSFDSIADDMALILIRSSYSGIVRDAMDFSTGVCDAEGRTLAQGVTIPMHLGSFYDAMRCVIDQYQGKIYPGDVFISNDPYVAAGVHLSYAEEHTVRHDIAYVKASYYAALQQPLIDSSGIVGTLDDHLFKKSTILG